MQSLSVAERNLGLPPSEIQTHPFGPPKVERRGQLLAIPRRQARALLYRLPAELHPIARETLCFLFWPDTSEDTARGNLSRLVSILHHGLLLLEASVTGQDQIDLGTCRLH